MPVVLFHRRFWPLIQSGSKLQTVRPGKIEPGKRMLLRGWSGVARRSPQISLRDTYCLTANHIRVELAGWQTVWIEIGGIKLPHREVRQFVAGDGFADLDDFRRYWFGPDGSGLHPPFTGWVMTWPPLPPRQSGEPE